MLSFLSLPLWVGVAWGAPSLGRWGAACAQPLPGLGLVRPGCLRPPGPSCWGRPSRASPVGGLPPSLGVVCVPPPGPLGCGVFKLETSSDPTRVFMTDVMLAQVLNLCFDEAFLALTTKRLVDPNLPRPTLLLWCLLVSCLCLVAERALIPARSDPARLP